MKKLFKFLIPAITMLTLSACSDAPDEQVVQSQTVQSTQSQSVPIPQVQSQQTHTPTYTMSQVDTYYNTCLMTNGIEQDDFCEEICSLKFDANSCDTIEDKYEIIFAALQKPSYNLNDVEYNYRSCLFKNGFDQDDYCEEACSFEFDANSCDIIEDRYEDLYGIGADKSKHTKLVRVRVRSESQWKNVGYTSGCSKWTPATSNRSNFQQTAQCKQKQVRNLIYTDGYTGKDYQYVSVKKTRQHTSNISKYETKKTNKVIQKNSVKADRYSSNLSRTKKQIDKTIIAKPTVNTKNVKAERYSSNLVRKENTNSRTEDKSVTNTSPPNETVAAVATASVVAVSASRYSSNLKSTKNKTDDKARKAKENADKARKAKEDANKREADRKEKERKDKVKRDKAKKEKARKDKARKDKAKRDAKKRSKKKK
jgi:hypothetical protein